MRFLLMFIIFFAGAPAYAAIISAVKPVTFGIVIVEYSGATVEINARNGPAVSHVISGGLSKVQGGSSGLIQVSTDMAGQSIMLTYPSSVFLKNGSNTMTVDGITSRSGFSAVSTGVQTIDFNIGGLLHIEAGQASLNYSESMIITVTINNP